MIQLKPIYPIFTLLFFLSVSCTKSPEDRMLEQALQLAGGNRAELERVLTHYAGEAQKLEAAKFLIRNMPGHYSYRDTDAIFRYALAVDSVVASMKGVTDFNVIRDSIDRVAQRMGVDTLETVQDCRIMTADFLVRHIDTAFRDWQEGPWARHVGFEDFCEWILPYKEEELQPLDDWRERLKGFCAVRLSDLDHCDQLRHSPLAAAKVLNGNLADSLHPVTGLSVRHADLPMETRARLPFGQCSDYAHMAVTVLRSHGIPVVTEYTPQWARRSLGHTWNVLLSEDGRRVAFGGISDRLGDLHKYSEKMAKVYRYTYAANAELTEMNRAGHYVPALFRNVFMRDVTRETIACRDATLRTSAKGRKSGYAYLFVFDNRDWTPVAYGKIRKGKATFRDMGLNVLYLAGTYEGGRMLPLSDPFVLDYDGTVRPVTADTCRRQELTLSRKYPVNEYAYEYIGRLRDGEFHASDRADFRTYHVVHRIKEGHASGQHIAVPDSIPACRYWRYTNNRYSTFCSMAEVMLYAKGDTARLKGRVIGTDGSWADSPEHLKETVFDGNTLTSFDAPRGEGCWAGLDLGRPVKVDHIVYYGRGDGNGVEAGDEYELLCWRDGEWESLGRQKATGPSVRYTNVPSGGLYLLRNHTKGVDERVFTYENGTQVWW